MYQITINNSLTFAVEGFSESYDKNNNRTVLFITGENSIENNGLDSLASLMKNIAADGSASMRITSEDTTVWESDLYVLDNATLTMMRKEIPIENSDSTTIKNYMSINISFIYEVKEGE